MVFPPWVQAVMAGVLGISVTLNLALLLRETQLAKLRNELATERVIDRHLVRNWIAAIELHVGLLRMSHNELILRYYPQDADRLTVAQPPPFDATGP